MSSNVGSLLPAAGRVEGTPSSPWGVLCRTQHWEGRQNPLQPLGLSFFQ